MSSAALLIADEAKLNSLSEGEVRAALKHHNPGAPPENLRTMAKIIAVVADVLAELPDARRRKLVKAKGELREALMQASRGARLGSARTSVEERTKVETSQGSGLGELLSLEEGQARLARYAIARPLDSWAGPVAGAGEIEEQLGIPRSTLSNWQQRGVVVGILRGERKLAYPLEQFVDARPLEGIADVLKVAPDARSAWLWLRQEHGALDDRTPLDLLHVAGGRERVAQVAGRDFA